MNNGKYSNLYQNIAAWLMTFAIIGFGWLYFETTGSVETPGHKAERIKTLLLYKGKASYQGNVVQVVSIEHKETFFRSQDIVTVKYDSGATAKFVLFDAIKEGKVDGM
mgnify:CR=1 FL=1